MPVRLPDRAEEAYAYPLLIKQLLHAPLATAADQEIVYRDRHRYTYREFRARLGRLANGLASLGVEQGATVAVMDWDSHRYLECFFGIPMMGAVLQTVNVRLSPEQVGYTLRHARAELALVHRDFVALLESLRSQLPDLRRVVLIRDAAGHPAASGAVDAEPPLPSWIDDEYEHLLARSPDEHAFADFDENAVATTFYTTGTTGAPKGVCFSHRQIVLHTLAILGACSSAPHGQSVRQGDVYMPMTPMFHVHAWGNPYLATALGLKQVYPGRYEPAMLLALRDREGVTYSHCVPTILQMLLGAADSTHADLHGWKICIGGSALSTQLAREALGRGIDVYAGYGMSETGPVLTISKLEAPAGQQPPDVELAQRCRAGTPLPLVELRLADADARLLPPSPEAVGEVVVRTPWTTQCYVGDAAASAELWRGGYLHTRDVGSIDASGSLQLTDRTKDVIKTGGEWLSSLQLEELISRHPGVAEVAVIAARDERWGERPLALVVPRPGHRDRLAADEIRDVVEIAVRSGALPKYAVLERVTFVDALERTSVGKINKRLLRERYGR
jgi:fatty-acyl-CoA synthase